MWCIERRNNALSAASASAASAASDNDSASAASAAAAASSSSSSSKESEAIPPDTSNDEFVAIALKFDNSTLISMELKTMERWEIRILIPKTQTANALDRAHPNDRDRFPLAPDIDRAHHTTNDSRALPPAGKQRVMRKV